MITVTKQITLNPGLGDTGPYTYTWSATGTTGCVSFSPSVTGTIVNPLTEEIITDIQFFNETCLEDTIISLVVTYNNGECSSTFPITIDNPCDDLEIGTITHTSPLTFSVAPTGGTPNYNYTWVYNTSLFAAVGSTNSNVLQLQFIGTGNAPSVVDIYCKVTDQNGCSSFTSRQATLCSPIVDNYFIPLECRSTFATKSLCIVPQVCPNTTIDWTKANFVSPNSGLTVTLGAPEKQCALAGGQRFVINSSVNVPAGIYDIPYTLTDNNGIQSNTGTIRVLVPNCGFLVFNPTNPGNAGGGAGGSSSGGGPLIAIENQSPFQIPCTAIVSDTFEIGPATNFVSSANTIDWDSLEIIDQATGTAAGHGPVTTPLSGSVIFNPATYNFEYTIPAVTGTDSFQWTVCDVNGNCATTSIYSIVLDCSRVPTAVNDTECGTCGVSIEHDVLTNDTINGILTNLQVTTAPSNGVAAFNYDYSSPRIIYTANSNYSGADSYVYTLTNDMGETDTATVTVTVICAGTDSNTAVCE